MMASPSRRHALEMNYGPHARWAFSYWAARRRLRSARQLGPNFASLSYPLIDSYPSPQPLQNLSVLRRTTAVSNWTKEEFSLCGSGRKSSNTAESSLLPVRASLHLAQVVRGATRERQHSRATLSERGTVGHVWGLSTRSCSGYHSGMTLDATTFRHPVPARPQPMARWISFIWPI
jgi:hypothetical protein